MSSNELRELLEVLSEYGVTRYKTADLEIRLEPTPAEATGVTVQSEPTDPEEIARRRRAEEIISKLGPDYVAARRAGLF